MDLEYYVLCHDFNSDTIEQYNIFDNGKIKDNVKELLENFITFDDFKENLDNLFIWAFAHKVEYEIMVRGMVCKYDKSNKFSIYDQLKPNLEIIARYIIEQWNNRKYGRTKIEI